MDVLRSFLLHLLLLLLPLASSTEEDLDLWLDPSVMLPHCNIFYPFGIPGHTSYMPGFQLLSCDQNGNMTLQLGNANVSVLELSLTGYIRVALGALNWRCRRRDLGDEPHKIGPSLVGTPYTFNDTRNKFTVIGCDALIMLRNASRVITRACAAYCVSNGTGGVTDGSCSGVGCCQGSVPRGLKTLDMEYSSIRNLSRTSGIPVGQRCSRAYVLEQQEFVFSAEDLQYSNQQVDVGRSAVLDWAVGNETCEVAARNRTTFACGENSYCYNSPVGGYRCNCSEGYAGNPYLQDGCTDINECDEVEEKYPCVHKCDNRPGAFQCSCPLGSFGDGRRDGEGCRKRVQTLDISLGTVLGVLLIVLVGILWAYWFFDRRKVAKQKEKYFMQNGGLLLQQHISTRRPTARIFSAEELENATNNFDETRVVGRGGYGTVYKGILLDLRVVAIKKAKVMDETQIEQFINEIVILSQIDHKNVVKLLGCCLETQIPLLVYEFISNGTLSHHLHMSGTNCSILSWENRLRIAVETAWALAYLHSLATIPIIHRDIKSANILLDENLTAKVSDFGASRLVPLDHTHVTTLVQGTIGYLDPEYFHTSTLTEKSDVYSFGVVLVELLTRKKPVSAGSERNLASHFVSFMEENRVVEVIDQRIVEEAGMRHLMVVSELARRCLSVKGEERPKMNEVLVELDALRRLLKQQHSAANQRDEISDICSDGILPPSSSSNDDDGIKKYDMESHLLSDTSGVHSM